MPDPNCTHCDGFGGHNAYGDRPCPKCGRWPKPGLPDEGIRYIAMVDGLEGRGKDVTARILKLQEDVDRAVGGIKDLRKRLDTAETNLLYAVDLLDSLADPDECHYDHHGYCQAHGVAEDCLDKKAKAFVKEIWELEMQDD